MSKNIVCSELFALMEFFHPRSLISFLQNTLGEWQSVFYIAASINVLGGLVYVMFGEGTVQPWAVHTDYSH